MKPGGYFRLLRGLTIAAAACVATPVLAQNVSSQTTKVIELERAGKFAEALSLAQKTLADAEKARGSVHRDVAAALNNLGHVHASLGQDAEAEPLYKRAIVIFERVGGLNSPDVAPTLNNLAALYQRQDRLADAEPLFRRALFVSERSLGLSHPDTGRSLNNLATLYEKLGRHGDSEPLFRRALAIYEKAGGPQSPAVATLLNNLGQVVKVTGRYAEAEPLIRRSLAVREKVLGQDHPDVARSLNNMGDLYERQRRYADAEPLFRRALAIRDRAVGPDHPETVVSINNLANLLRLDGRVADALPLLAPLIIAGRAQARVALPALYEAQRQQIVAPATALNDALNVIQRGSQSSAATALNKLAVRLAAGNDRLAELVRRDQDLGSEGESLDKSIMAAMSKDRAKRDPSAEQRARARISAIAAERANLQKVLASEFPDYSVLSNPLPLTSSEVRSLLSAEEAIVLFAIAEQESYVLALTRDAAEWKSIPRGSDALSEQIVAFRRGLDFAKASDASGKAGLFDLGLANELYTLLLSPVEALIRDKRSLVVVPAGALTALPFHLLVTDKPGMAIPEKFDGYRDAAWLLKRHAVSVLPSVTSLKALRSFTRRDQNVKPMTGFGDPLFNPAQGAGGKRAGLKTDTRGVASVAYTEFWRGAGVDRARLAEALQQLPDTADELQAVARDLGATASDIHLGSDASETTLKRTRLSDYAIIYFATHGLVAGDVKGLGEPSLALSIPAQPTEFDDGLLTSSEVAQLNLNADWVVLSACNTIAGDRPGAEALSGLARSFFYAGARALLVTHWAVDSAAATRLTTTTFDRLKVSPNIGRAEALRQAMLAYLDDTSSPRNAYPALWGPFAIIGEGVGR